MAWWWAPILLFIGAVFGIMITAVVTANDKDEKDHHRRWWDE